MKLRELLSMLAATSGATLPAFDEDGNLDYIEVVNFDATFSYGNETRRITIGSDWRETTEPKKGDTDF